MLWQGFSILCSTLEVVVRLRLGNTAVRRFLSRGKNPNRDENRPPSSSFPLLSGDTFRQLAGTRYEGGEFSRVRGLPETVCFVKAECAGSEGFVESYANWATSLGQPPILLLHNSDVIPEPQTMNFLAEISKRVYCVNVVAESAKVFALPIGLENASLDKNGRLSLFLDIPFYSDEARPRRVLSSFHEQTNPLLRGEARRVLEESRFGHDGVKWKRQEYRDEVIRSKFVISPPGNGADTHRTWEAIYLGAVPVVMQGHLAPSLIRELPILAVESYRDFVQLSDETLDELYVDISRKPVTRALASYWAGEILKLTSGV